MTVTSEVKKKGKIKNNLKEWSLFINGKVVGRFLLCCNKIDLIPPPKALYYSNAPPPPLTVNFFMYSLNTLLATTNPPPPTLLLNTM